MTYRRSELIARVEHARNRIVLAAGLSREQAERAATAIAAMDDLLEALLDDPPVRT